MKKIINYHNIKYFTEFLPPLVRSVIKELDRLEIIERGSDINIKEIKAVLDGDPSDLLAFEYWDDHSGVCANLSMIKAHELNSIVQKAEESKLEDTGSWDVILFDAKGNIFDTAINKVIVVNEVKLIPRRD